MTLALNITNTRIFHREFGVMVLYKTEPIEKILKLVILSGWIKNAETISCLIVCKVGGGKTSIVNKYIKTKKLLFITDTTAFGIINEFYPQLVKGEVNHIVIPDLISPLSRSQSTVNTFIAFMNNLIEEGVFRASTGTIRISEYARVGLISTIAKEDLFDKRHGWTRIGFLSRLIPISYEYSKSDAIDIITKLSHDDIERNTITDFKIPEKPVEIKGDNVIFEKLVPFAVGLQEAEGVYGFRRIKQLKILTMANALLNGRDKVNEEDFLAVKELLNYINLDCNKL
jgi:hypothetical protein